MGDTTVKKTILQTAPHGALGQAYLTSGKHVAMRLWRVDPPGEGVETVRDYETVGYVVRGRAHLHLEDQMVKLEPGDSWLVPPGAKHRYEILEAFEAVEATSPPAHVHGRDDPPAR